MAIKSVVSGLRGYSSVESLLVEVMKALREKSEVAVGEFFKELVSLSVVSHDLIQSVASCGNLPQYVYEALFIHSVQSNPHGYVVDYYCTDKDLCCALASNSSVSERILTDLHSLYDEDVNVALSGNPKTPSEILNKLRWGTNRCQKAFYAGPAATESMLLDIYDDGRDGLFYSAAANPNTPASVLKDIFDYDIRYWNDLASNPRIDSSLLRRMVEEFESNPGRGIRILEAVASNPNAGDDVLMSLTFSCLQSHNQLCYRILEYIASNPSVSSVVLAVLAEFRGFPDGKNLYSSSEEAAYLVRGAVARNHNASRETLVKLCGDKVNSVAYYAVVNPLMRDMIESPEHVSVIRDTLSGIFGRANAAMNPDTPSGILEYLVDKGHCLEEISMNSNIPERCLPVLLGSDNVRVVLNALVHPKMQQHMDVRIADLEGVVSSEKKDVSLKKGTDVRVSQIKR